MRPALPCALSVLLAFGAAAAPAPATSSSLTVYRCVDAHGGIALRDSPCPRGTRQDVRLLPRPVDSTTPLAAARPPAGAPSASLAVGIASTAPASQVLAEPAATRTPHYTCLRPDGTRYTSDSDAGHPRAVPLRTLGPGALSRRDDGSPLAAANLWGDDRGRSGVPVTVFTTEAGDDALVWVRDDCRALPPLQACAALRAQRDALGQRAFNAQPGDRTSLERDRDALVDRIRSEC